MRRLKRILLNAVTILSAAICVTTAALWARSFRLGTALGWTRPNVGAIGVVCNGGSVTVSWGPSVGHGGSVWRKKGRSYHTWGTEVSPLKDHPKSGSAPAPPQVGPWVPWDWADGWLDQEYGFSGSYLGPWPVPLNRVVITDNPKDWSSVRVDRTEWEAAGFRYELNLRVFGDLTANVRSRRLLLSTWFVPLVIALAAVLPVMRVRPYLHSRREWRQGRCGVCGYDLRATPRRCPECGAVPADGV